MGDARLSIQVSAEVGQFVSGMKQADSSLAKSQASAESLASTFSTTLFNAFNKIKGGGASKEVEILTNKIIGLKEQFSAIKPSIDLTQFDSALSNIQSRIKILERVDIGANFSQVEASIEQIANDISRLRDVSFSVQIDSSQSLNAISALNKELDELKSKNQFGLTFDSSQALAALEKVKANVATLIAEAKITGDTSILDNALKNVRARIESLDTAVKIFGDTSQIESEIPAIKQQLSGLSTTIEVLINESNLKAQIEQTKAGLKAGLASIISSVNLTGDSSAFDSTIQSIKARIESLDTSIELTGDTAALETKINEIRNDLISLSTGVALKIEEGNLTQQIAFAKSQLATISSSVKIGTDTTGFDAAIVEVRNKLSLIDDLSVDITANKVPLEAAIKDVSDDLSRLKGSVVTLNADGKPAIRSINELEQELDELSLKLKNSTDPKDFDRLGRSISLVREQLRNVSSQGVQTAFRGVSKTGNEASQTLINLSRVAQDAPFGFLGIANNLNPLVESFQRLSASAKQTGTSLLSSLGTALSGPAGIGLGIGIVSALLIKFGDNLNFSTKGVSGLSLALGGLSSDLNTIKSDIDDLEKSFKFIQSLEDINIDIKLGTGSLQGGLEKLRTQFSLGSELERQVTQDATTAFNILQQSTRAALENLSRKGLETVASLSGQFKDIPEIIAAELSEGDQKLIKFAADAERTLIELQNKERTSREQNVLTIKQIELQKLLIQKDLGDKQKELYQKQLAELEKIQNDTISRARQFVKEFGQSFILPDLEDSFFKTKDQLFKASRDLLTNVRKFLAGNQEALTIKIPLNIESSQITETITKDVEKLNEVIGSLRPLKLTTEGDFKEAQKQLSELDNKEILLKINQQGDVLKIAEQLRSLKGVEIPVVIEQEGDINKIAEQLKSLKPVDIKITGDAQKVLTDLSKIQDVSVSLKLNQTEALKKLDSIDREITVAINAEGNIIEVAEQLKDLKGVEIPIVVNNAGDIQNIANELRNLKTFNLTITGNVKEVLSDLNKISGIKLPEPTLPIFINERGVIRQITRAFDGAIKVVQTKEIRIPVVTDADIKIAENLAKEVELSKSIIDNFFAGIASERNIPVTIDADFSLLKNNIDLINKKLDLKARFNELGSAATKAFNKIDFSNLERGVFKAENLIKSFENIQKAIDEALTNISIEGFSNIGKSIGEALAGGDITNGFKAFASIVSQALISLGEQMIALSPVIAALKAAIKSLNPAVLLPAGIALVAIGQALRASVNKGIRGFAEGGLVFGPTMGLVGEGSGTSRSNPEIIAPLDKLKKFLPKGTSQSQVFLINSKSRGRDLSLVLARTNRSRALRG